MSVETGTRLEAFRRTLPFELDPFQVEAIVKLGTHKGVLVSAPTSSGKTVVADYAIYEAMEDGVKAIYTTPLKALSNQKFRDLKKRYGDAYVGLVTGEHTINEQAPVVVMTTEILRNLIYDDPQRLKDVRYVVLDEVHYIDDYPRGAVWEEVMIQAPPQIHFVGLSATISNYQQVADWMESHRGEMGVVAVFKRPTELRLWLAIHNQIYPLFDEQGKVVRETWNRAQEEVIEVGEQLSALLRFSANHEARAEPEDEREERVVDIFVGRGLSVGWRCHHAMSIVGARPPGWTPGAWRKQRWRCNGGRRRGR
jgi:ATP-dependent RNA helicase HelY